MKRKTMRSTHFARGWRVRRIALWLTAISSPLLVVLSGQYFTVAANAATFAQPGPEASHAPSQAPTITITKTSNSGSTKTAIKFSFEHGSKPALTAAINSALEHGASMKATPSAASSGYADLYCNTAYDLTDSDGTFSYQHSCGGSTSPWGWQMSSALQVIVTSTVDENGMVYSVNGGPNLQNAPHAEAAGYVFHGTFNPVNDGDNLTYIDTLDFTVEVGGQTGSAQITISGNIHQLGNPPPPGTTPPPGWSGGGSGPQPTMMVVGDSISQGFEGDVTWRYDLATVEQNVPGFHFVGPWPGTTSLPASLPANWPTVPASPIYNGAYAPGEAFPENDSQHYARWGRQMTEAATNIESTVASYMPNYLLVALGFNDLAFGIQNQTTLLNTVQSFVSAARAANPSIRILFANVPQRSPLAVVPNLPSVISAYDQALPATLASLSTAQSPVELVPFASNYSYSTDSYDGLHPNNIGEWAIADAFANALSSDFGVGGGSSYLPSSEVQVPVSTPPAPTLTPNAGGIDISWPHEFGAEGYMLEVANLTWGQTLGASTELPLPIPADSWELEQLVPGDQYEIAIQAVRGYEQSGWSGAAEATANPTTPAPPTSISVIPQSGGISVSWTTPTGQNDSNITGYTLSWLDSSNSAATLHTTTVTGNSYEITDGNGISPRDLINIAMSAVNPSGEGYPTGSIAIPDEGAPSAPTITSDTEIDTNTDVLTFTSGSSASTAGYWVDIFGGPGGVGGETLPYELPASDTSFTSGYLLGAAASVRTCFQAANGTLLSTLNLSGSDCAVPAGGSSSTARLSEIAHGAPANAGIPYSQFNPRFRLLLEGAASLTSSPADEASAGVTSSSGTNANGALVPAFSPDSVQAVFGDPADLVVIVPPNKYR